MDQIPTYQARYNRIAGSGIRRSNPNPAQAPYAPSVSPSPTLATSYATPTYATPAPVAAIPPVANQPYTTSRPSTARPATPAAPGVVTDPTNVGQQVGAFQNYAREGVQAYGDLAGQDFRKNVGSMLGDLNSIGALRSGATVSGLNDLTTNYGRQIGNYASMATQGAIGEGQRQASEAADRQYRADAEQRARKQSTLGTIGKLIGGVGGLLPGPFGTAAKVIGSVF